MIEIHHCFLPLTHGCLLQLREETGFHSNVVMLKSFMTQRSQNFHAGQLLLSENSHLPLKSCSLEEDPCPPVSMK